MLRRICQRDGAGRHRGRCCSCAQVAGASARRSAYLASSASDLRLDQREIGLEELYRDCSKTAFLKALQRYLPDLRSADLLPGPSGVRAQALAPDGVLLDDFLVDEQGGMLHVRNAPSPAATSSLAIAEMIVTTAEKQFGLA